MIVRTNEEYF